MEEKTHKLKVEIIMEDYIKNTIAGMIQGDGGWVEFVSFKDNRLTLLFRAECSKCFILDRCCNWIKGRILEDLGQNVEIEAIRKKPFFWET
ncbi:NifU-like domain-containing protein [Butyrivibrio proteoclasticus]|uniref:NifU-like domain-containing protein n=2 Tax=Butyrivibrio proteoclasticus TaxID=43305 RepID=A0A1I5XF55_9FIRM|nr:NifU-like domain-containing protein [Butyrivibrio proteoclasticus]